MMQPMQDAIRPYAGQASTDETSAAKLIVEYAHITAASMRKAFQDSLRGPGATTDEQQDILRSMLVFAGAGLDSSVKQLAQDSLPVLARYDATEAREELVKFSVRKLRGLEEGGAATRFLVQLLLADAEATAIDEFVGDLTGGSLQSVDALHKMCGIFGIASPMLKKQIQELRPAFEARNTIIHEMDMDFSAPNRNRRSRRREQMVVWANRMLEVAERIVDDVDARIAGLR